MRLGWKKRCQQLQAQNQELEQRKLELQKRVAELENENARLREALAAAQKTSSNSSKPPSSDIVKPSDQRKGRKGGKGRKTGAQKGHPKHEPLAFSPDQVEEQIPHRLPCCPLDATHRILDTDQVDKRVQQVELPSKLSSVTEHLSYRLWCQDCQQYHSAPLPPEVLNAGLFGPRLTSFVVYLKGELHGSYSGIQGLLQQVLSVKVSRGYLVKLVQKASEAFEAPCNELLHALPEQPQLNVDETSHKENGQLLWTWCFRAAFFVVFKIGNRSAEILQQILGPDFEGILGCDCYSAYRKFARQSGALLQFCLAHLIREVKFLCEHSNGHVQKYGHNLLQGLKELFKVLDRKEQLPADQFQEELAQAEERIWKAALAPRASPKRFGDPEIPRPIENMVQRFLDYGQDYFRFITSPEVDPTNNSAERAIRFVILDRTVTQGTRSWRGRQSSERLWTVLGTCKLQNRPAFEWMFQAITAHYSKQPAPSLLPGS